MHTTDDRPTPQHDSYTMQAMILAAGLGTRLRPLTDRLPKALVPVGGMPLLGRLMLRLKASGCRRVVVNIHHMAEQIEAYLRQNDCFGLDVRLSDERQRLLDTGGGLRRAASLFLDDEPILIHNVDILTDMEPADLYHACLTTGDDARRGATLVVSPRQTTRYLLFDDTGQLKGWLNTLTGERRGPYAESTTDESTTDARLTRLAFSGIHVFAPQLFPLMEGLDDKFGIIDFYLRCCDSVPIRALTLPGLRLMDVGKTDSLQEAELFARTIGQH